MPEGKVITIRVNEQDIEAMELLKEWLEEKYKDLPPKYRKATSSDIFKYALHSWVRNYNNPEDMIL